MAWPGLWWVPGILAAPGEFLPEVVTPAVEAAWEAHHREAGLSGPNAEIPCTPFAEDLVLCLRMVDGPASRPVTAADLEVQGVSLPAAQARAVAAIRRGLSPDRPEVVRVADDPRAYLLSAAGDGYDQAGLFDPDALAARAGGPVAVGIPVRGVFIAFRLADPDLARIVAVGIRRAFETLAEPITDTLYTWDGRAWIAWGRSQPADAMPAPDRPSPQDARPPVP